MKLEYLAEGSPDCPLLRLYDFDVVEAVRLREAFRSLATGAVRVLPLHEEWWIQPIEGCALELRLSSRDLGVVQRLPSKFDCSLTAEGWIDMALLADTFCASLRPEGCQWLSDSGEISLLLSPSGRW